MTPTRTPPVPPKEPTGTSGTRTVPTLPARLGDTSVLLVVLVYGSGLFIGLRIELAGVPLGWPLFAVLALSLVRYAYALLHATAHDRPQLPPPEADTLHPFGEWRLAVHFALFAIVLAWPAALHHWHGNELAGVLLWPALALVLSVFPASSALVAITGSLTVSLNPWQLGEFFRAIGPRYAMLPVTLAALLLPGSALVALLHGLGRIAQWFASCMGVWLLLAAFAITGTWVGRHRPGLDLSSNRDLRRESDERRWHREHMQALDLAYASLRSGFLEQGYARLRDMLAEEDDDPALYQWLLNRLAEWEDPRHARAVAARFAERLLALKRTHEALELAEHYRRRSAGFRLPRHVAAPLSAYAREIGHHWLADELQADLRLSGDAAGPADQ